MKRVLAVSTLGLMLAFSGSVIAAAAADRHPNLTAAHKDLEAAILKIVAAQKANEYDMAGHAQKAKELVEKAVEELQVARGEANLNAPKK
jgi:hypothetical protein